MSFRFKLFNKTASAYLLSGLLFCLISATLLAYPLTASGADPKKELGNIRKKLKKEEQKIVKAIKEEKSILTELEMIQKSVIKKKSELKYFDGRLQKSQTEMKLLREDISALEGKMENRKDMLKKRLKTLYKEQYSGDTALILISARNYNDLLRKSRYISLLAHYDSTLMDKYREEIMNYNHQQRKMEALQNDLEANKRNVRKNMIELQEERSSKDSLLASVKDKRSSYEKMVRELKDSSVKLQKKIMELEKSKVKESFTGKGFSSMKGALPWPVDGKVLVPFGKYKDPKYNIPVFKNGIEIKTEAGATASSVHGGRAVYADWFEGYGQLLIINHDKGYHSLYGNLSELFYKAGDIIKKGSNVGKIGEKGLLNVPTLYFEIRHKGKPIDPLGWLKQKRKINTKMTGTKKTGTKIKRQIKKKR